MENCKIQCVVKKYGEKPLKNNMENSLIFIFFKLLVLFSAMTLNIQDVKSKAELSLKVMGILKILS